MGKVCIKLFFSFAAFIAVNFWLCSKAAAKGAEFFISPVVEETLLFILLQLFMVVNYRISPLETTKQKKVYWWISEILVFVTFFFWGIFIVGPIWFKN